MLPDPNEHPVLTVEKAGRLMGLGRTGAYEAAHRGEIPTLSFGRRLLVPTAALRRLLEIDQPENTNAASLTRSGARSPNHATFATKATRDGEE